MWLRLGVYLSYIIIIVILGEDKAPLLCELILYFARCHFFLGRARRAGQCLLFYAKMRNVKKANYLSYTKFFCFSSFVFRSSFVLWCAAKHKFFLVIISSGAFGRFGITYARRRWPAVMGMRHVKMALKPQPLCGHILHFIHDKNCRCQRAVHCNSH